MVLTSKQKEDLNKAILEYLIINKYPESAKQFSQEAKIDDFFLQQEQKQQFNNILEKKWVSIIRLQNKVLELEKQVQQMQQQQPRKNFQNTAANQSAIFPVPPQKFTLKGHQEVVNHLALHPDYSILASCSEDGTIKLWEFEQGRFERTLKGHTGSVNAIAFDHQNRYLASCSSDITIRLWDLTNFNCVKTLYGHEHNISDLEFSGDFLVSCSRDKTIKLWNIETGYCLRTFNHHTEWVRSLSLCTVQNQTFMITGSSDQQICIWNLQTEAVLAVLSGHENVVERVKLLPLENSRKILSGAEYVKKAQNHLENAQKIKELLQNAENKTETTNQPQFTEGQVQKVCPLLALSASRDKTIRLWNCSTQECIKIFLGHDNWVKGLCLESSGKYFYSSSDDKSLRVWDFFEGREVRKVVDAHAHFVSFVVQSAKYGILASCSVDKSIKIWDLD